MNYDYFSKHYKLIEIDLSKQIELEILGLKQQINFIGNLEEDNGTTMFFIIDVMDSNVIDRQTAKDKYNQNNSIQFKAESIKSSLCDYSDAFILVTGDVAVAANNDTDVAFKDCPPFSTCKTEIDDVFIDEANHI